MIWAVCEAGQLSGFRRRGWHGGESLQLDRQISVVSITSAYTDHNKF